MILYLASVYYRHTLRIQHINAPFPPDKSLVARKSGGSNIRKNKNLQDGRFFGC